MLGFEAPALTVVPPFALPDRNRGLERIDTEASGRKGIGSVRRRGNHDHGAVADHEFTDSVDHDEPTEIGPTVAGFGGELGKSGLHLGFVRFVLELIDTGAVAAVVTGNAREQDHRAAVWPVSPVERLGDRKRLIR